MGESLTLIAQNKHFLCVKIGEKGREVLNSGKAKYFTETVRTTHPSGALGTLGGDVHPFENPNLDFKRTLHVWAPSSRNNDLIIQSFRHELAHLGGNASDSGGSTSNPYEMNAYQLEAYCKPSI